VTEVIGQHKDFPSEREVDRLGQKFKVEANRQQGANCLKSLQPIAACLSAAEATMNNFFPKQCQSLHNSSRAGFHVGAGSFVRDSSQSSSRPIWDSWPGKLQHAHWQDKSFHVLNFQSWGLYRFLLCSFRFFDLRFFCV